MKKILFTAYNLDVGGIEKALIALLKTIDYNKYDVTLILEKKEGKLLHEVPQNVHIKEYRISTCKIAIIRKIINRTKLILTALLNYNRYDYACCYATYSIPSSKLVKKFSRNNCLWVHSDYYYLYGKKITSVKSFFNTLNIEKFKNIIFVSNEARDNFIKIYPNLIGKTLVCNNLIDYKGIKELSNEKLDVKKPNKLLFLNVSRHDESSKRLTRLINASKRLIDDGYDFEVWLVGTGEATTMYEKMIKDFKLEKNVKLLGMRKNPYPFYKIADAFVLTSEYEGFPVTFVEALIFNIPIISTINVTDGVIDISSDYGIVVENNDEDIYFGMKEFIKNGFTSKQKFDVKKFNETMLEKLDNIIDDKDVK